MGAGDKGCTNSSRIAAAAHGRWRKSALALTTYAASFPSSCTRTLSLPDITHCCLGDFWLLTLNECAFSKCLHRHRVTKQPHGQRLVPSIGYLWIGQHTITLHAKGEGMDLALLAASAWGCCLSLNLWTAASPGAPSWDGGAAGDILGVALPASLASAVAWLDVPADCCCLRLQCAPPI